MPDLISASDAAALYGYASGDNLNRTLRYWRSKPHLPTIEPAGRQTGQGGEHLYDAAELAAAMADRPRPARPDLRRTTVHTRGDDHD